MANVQNQFIIPAHLTEDLKNCTACKLIGPVCFHRKAFEKPSQTNLRETENENYYYNFFLIIESCICWGTEQDIGC